MAVTTAQGVDVSQVLAGMLEDVEGLRVCWYVSDTARPPVAVIGLPTIDWQDRESTFCWATWDFTITLIVARNNDRDAQMDLSRLVRDVADALDGPTPAGVFDVRPMEARPGTASISGQELPAYNVRCQVRA